jgi:flagellar biosynthetic protein FlhB
MADNQDPASKTEDPTGRQLEKAHDEGNVAQSKELGHLLALLGGVLILTLMATPIARRVQDLLARFLAEPELMVMDGPGVQRVLLQLLGDLAGALAPAFALLLVLGAGASLIQNRPGIAWEKIQPDLSRLSPIEGAKRLFSVLSAVEFVKNLLKIAIVAAVVTAVVWPQIHRLPGLITMEVADLPAQISKIVVLIFGGVIAIMATIAAADILYQKMRHFGQLRMTRQEVRDEHKQSEGDPLIKARLRSIRQERSRKRMMAAVPKADVVITNPTHYAVALKYDDATMSAPTVVAKGQDDMARRIRELAAEHRVPVVQNPPLARALYAVDVDREVPPEHYRAVAEVIGFVMRLRGRPPVKAAPAAPRRASPPATSRGGSH